MKCLLCGKNTDFLLTKTLRGGRSGKVFLCNSCELGVLDNVVSKEEIINFYKNEYRKHALHKQSDTPEELFNLYSNFQNDRISLIKQYLNKRTALLEVGCSVGMFLYNVRDYTKRIIGIDYDTESVKFASDKCGCIVFDRDIEKTGLPKECFDIICMYQVLEHSWDPLDLISRYKKYLKPGGIIVVEVPNINDSLRYVYNLPNHNEFYYHPAHLWYFSKKSLNTIMKKSGFTGDIVFTQSYNILNHMHWIDTDTAQKNCVAGLSVPSFTFKDDVDDMVSEKLNEFIQTIDAYYKKLLCVLGISDNITFIGRKNG
jgi:2-polyprenyl-3-methyl-5-hydroxy-6-metoxy-1,4-benzoquinol methylase